MYKKINKNVTKLKLRKTKEKQKKTTIEIIGVFRQANSNRS